MDTQKNWTKRCNTCGELSPDNMKFCRYCGSRLEDIEVVVQPGEEQQERTSWEEKTEWLKESAYVPPVTEEKPQEPEIIRAPDPERVGSTASSSLEMEAQKKPLSNGLKVFLSVLCAALPGFGQVICLIFAIVFMNSDEDADRQSFGSALLVASLIMFVITCVIAGILALTVYSPPS